MTCGPPKTTHPRRAPTLSGSAPLTTDFQATPVTTQAPARLEPHPLTTSSRLKPTADGPDLGQGFQRVRDVRSLQSGQTTHQVS
jgi:hypothetical protein